VTGTIKKTEEIQGILRQACARQELLILATPYLRFESAFVGIQGAELHIQATMTRDDAMFGLKGPDLKVRFPDGLGFYEAPVEMLGLGLLGGRRTVRLSIPKLLLENDQRAAYRAERVGRVMVTYSTPRGDLVQGSLVDISTTGARIHAQKDINPEIFRPGFTLALSIPLSDEIRIETGRGPVPVALERNGPRIVFGRMAGMSMSEHARRAPEPDRGSVRAGMAAEHKRMDSILGGDGNEMQSSLREELKAAMWSCFGIFRREERMETGLAKIREVQSRIGSVSIGDKGKRFNQALVELGINPEIADPAKR